MSAGNVYWVRSLATEEPYRVSLSVSDEGWTFDVSRGTSHWKFDLGAGAKPGRLRLGHRHLESFWEAGQGDRGRLVLDGLSHDFEVQTDARHRVAALRDRGPGKHGGREIRAPMPGLVVRLEVADGEPVASGQGIAIIEAMKMENEITAPIAGRVVELSVAAGETVDAGQILCRVEPDG